MLKNKHMFIVCNIDICDFVMSERALDSTSIPTD